MAPFLIVVLLILIVKFWLELVLALGFYLGWIYVIGPWDERQARERADILRHARARAQIDATAFATALAMRQAAGHHAEGAIESTATEITPSGEDPR